MYRLIPAKNTRASYVAFHPEFSKFNDKTAWLCIVTQPPPGFEPNVSSSVYGAIALRTPLAK